MIYSPQFQSSQLSIEYYNENFDDEDDNNRKITPRKFMTPTNKKYFS